jgi:hypothetical protein
MEMDINEIWLWLIGGGTVLFTVVMIVLTALCTILPIAGIAWFIFRRKQKADAVRQASQSWVATTGRVIKSRVEVSGGEMTTVSPRVIYEYEVGARTYQCDQIRAGDKFLSMRTSEDAYRIIDRYPEDLEVRVYYNPYNPAEATLER